MGRASDKSDRHVSERTANVVRLGSVLYALIWVGYSISSDTSHMSPPILYLLGAAWVALAWYVYRSVAQTVPQAGLRILLYHVLSAIYLALIVDLDSPLIYLWALLIIASGVYFGKHGGFISAGALVVLSIVVSIAGTAGFTSGAAMVFTLLSTIFIGGIAMYAICQTIQDQQELDESHEQASLQRDRTTTLINNLTDAVLSTDQNGKIVLYNAALLSLLDTNANLDDKNIDDVLRLRTQQGEVVSLADEFYDTTTTNVRDDLVTFISNEETRVEVSYSPIRSSFDDPDAVDSIGGFIVIIRDITASKSLEEERDEFISVISHELRTPITIAEGTVSNAQVMLERKDIPHTKVKTAIDIAHEQVVFLARMVNDLSTLSRAERGIADEAEEIDVNELANLLFQEYEPEAEDKGLAFNLRVPAKVGSVFTSRLYLKELLQNFITNAIKYTHEGSITLEITKSRSGKVTFAVCDSGIGISRADQKRIFEKFYRAEDYRTRETSGTGLGLYVSQKLARKIGTTIEMKSRLNHGSTFSIELPLVTATKASKKP